MGCSSRQLAWGSLILAILTVTGCAKAADVTNPPVNTVGLTGESTMLTCAVTGDVVTDPFEWREWVSTNNPDGNRIFTAPEVDPLDTSMYAIHDAYNLEILNLDWKANGGDYGCKVWTMSSSVTAHVFVFDPHIMTVNSMKVGDVQEVVCESWFGAVDNLVDSDIDVPTMTMDVAGNSLTVVTTLTVKTADTPYILRGRANYTGQSSHDGKDFGCTITIYQPNNQLRFISPMDIQHSVETPLFYPNQAIYYVGDYINCSASGNPLPDYTWVPIDSNFVGNVESHMLQITQDMVGYNDWQCKASNQVGSDAPTETSSSISFDAEANPDDPGGVTSSGVEGWKIAVGICVPLAIIAIVVGIVLGIKYKKKKQRAAAYASKVPPPEVGTHGSDNKGAAFPGDGELSNGKPRDTNAARTPISQLPDPMSQNAPANRSRDSPGYADLGIKQITGSSSDLGLGGLPWYGGQNLPGAGQMVTWYGGQNPRYPGVNVSVNSSMDSFDDVEPSVMAQPNPRNTRQPPPGILRNSPTGRQPPPDMQQPPSRYTNTNPSFERESPQPNRGRPMDLDIKPNHPDTFV